jgi:lactoylglutathione lyase
MRYLHTMLRVRDLDKALDFYRDKLGLKEARRITDEKGRFTLVFLGAPEDEKLVGDSGKAGRAAPLIEPTYNWDTEDYGEARYFGHLAYEVDDIYALCEKLMKAGVVINRLPRDGRMAFLCARRTSSRSSCCRKATRCRLRNRGSRCRIRAL